MHIAVAVRLMPKAGDELEVQPGDTDIDRELVEICLLYTSPSPRDS